MIMLNNMKTTTKINQKSRERERERERGERERESERERERERMLLCAASNYLTEFVIPWQNGRTG